ncbi:hypothetical protein SESBI_05703, partial [Sesbania bispinosa]
VYVSQDTRFYLNTAQSCFAMDAHLSEIDTHPIHLIAYTHFPMWRYVRSTKLQNNKKHQAQA